jgi:hypothetical protein
MCLPELSYMSILKHLFRRITFHEQSKLNERRVYTQKNFRRIKNRQPFIDSLKDPFWEFQSEKPSKRVD